MLPSDTHILTPSVTKNVNTRSEGGRWSWETKQDVTQKMLLLGDMRKVSQLTGVDYQTIVAWRKTDWYKELMGSYREERALRVDSKMASLVDKTLEVVEDRLENGEYILNNKTGEIIRKPVAMKDAAAVARDLLVRQEALRKEVAQTETHKETVKETLSLLAKEFARWAKTNKTAGAEDIEYVEEVPNAVHDQR